MIVRARSIVECEKIVAIKKREGWSPVNDMKPKLDDSMLSYGDVSYVVVMERPDTKEHKETSKRKAWNRRNIGGLYH